MEFIPRIFWITLMVWVYAEATLVFRYLTLKSWGAERQQLINDRTLRFYTIVSVVSVNLAAIIGGIIILVSLSNLLGG